MPTEQTEPLTPIRFQTNVIAQFPDAPGGARFINAGEDSPYRSIDEVPVNLRPLVVTDELDEPEPNLPRGSFEMGVSYETTPDGRLGRQIRRRVERQVAALEAQEELTEWIEEESERPLPPEVAESLQASHEDSVAFTKAEMAAAARMSDQLADAIIDEQKPVERFVRRGSRHYVQIHRTKLRPAESVFTKDEDGAYQCIGTTDAKAQPPEPPLVL